MRWRGGPTDTKRCVRGSLSLTAALSAVASSRPPERAGGRVPRVHVPNARRRKRAGGWVERVCGRDASDATRKTPVRQGGALIAALGDQTTRTANTDIATWAFDAPAGERIAGATLWRAGDADGGAVINAHVRVLACGAEHRDRHLRRMRVRGSECPRRGATSASPCQPRIALSCQLPTWVASLRQRLMRRDIGIQMQGRQHDPNGYAAAVYLYAADIVLEQSGGPTRRT